MSESLCLKQKCMSGLKDIVYTRLHAHCVSPQISTDKEQLQVFALVTTHVPAKNISRVHTGLNISAGTDLIIIAQETDHLHSKKH